MNAVTESVFNRLATSQTLIGMVGVLEGSPAIFSTSPIPPTNATESEKNATFPMVQIEDIVSDLPFDTKTTSGREIVMDIGCYALQDGSLIAVNDLAEEVRSLFDTDLVVTGYDNVLTIVVGGPVPSDGDRVYGRIITIRLILEKEQ